MLAPSPSLAELGLGYRALRSEERAPGCWGLAGTQAETGPIAFLSSALAVKHLPSVGWHMEAPSGIRPSGPQQQASWSLWVQDPVPTRVDTPRMAP